MVKHAALRILNNIRYADFKKEVLKVKTLNNNVNYGQI